MATKQDAAKRRKASAVRAPALGKDVAVLLCGGCSDGSHQGLDDGDYLIELFGNSNGFKKLGRYFSALAELDTSDDRGFHHHFFKVRSLSKTKIELIVRKNETADIKGML